MSLQQNPSSPPSVRDALPPGVPAAQVATTALTGELLPAPDFLDRSYLKSQLKSILQSHEGRARAIKAHELANLVDQDERRVRVLLRELITEGMPIASTTEAPAGYFLISNWKEAQKYAVSIRSRVIEDAIRRRDFNRSAALYLKPAEQGKLL